jgi:hypothetical protein
VLAVIAATQSQAGTGSSSDLRVAGSDSSPSTSTAVQWAGYEWRGRPPVTVTLDSHLVNPNLQAAVDAAAASWSASDVVDVVVGGRGKHKVSLYEDHYGLGQPAAWTQVFKRNGYITSVTIYVNDDLLVDPSLWTSEWAICHEVGHGLGLDHQMGATTPSCMSPDLPGTAPNQQDFAQLDLIY